MQLKMHKQKMDKGISLSPLYKVYHQDNKTSKFYYKIPQAGLLYQKKNQTDSVFISDASLKIEVFSLRDSLVYKDIISISDIKKSYYTSINSYRDIKLSSGSDYIFRISIHDKNRDKIVSTVFEVKKKKDSSREHFLVLDSLDNVWFHNYTDTQIKIKSKYNQIYISKYHKDKNKRYGTFMVKSDELFNLVDEGTYLVQSDTTHYRGLYIIKTYEGYPLISQKKSMTSPLVYIADASEYKKIIQNKFPKLVSELYWMKLADNEIGFAKKLLKSYYKRVEYANKKYTSYKQGWQTDRGMVYILLGLPSYIYYTIDQEKWVYGKDHYSLSIEYKFNKSSDLDDYVLEEKNNILYLARKHWQTGKIFDNRDIINIQEEHEREQERQRNIWNQPYHRSY